jgi:hypothetical protein
MWRLCFLAAVDKKPRTLWACHCVTFIFSASDRQKKAQAQLDLQPGAKIFEVLSEGGSGVIRKSVLHKLIKTELEASQPDLRRATRIAAENYSFTLVGMGEQDSRRCYILQAVPKVATKYLLAGRLWVDAEDFAITRIEGSPAVKPSIWIRKTTFVHTYRKVGGFWLPASNSSESDVRIYGRTIVKVEYGDYKITTAGSAFPAVISVGSPRGGIEQ